MTEQPNKPKSLYENLPKIERYLRFKKQLDERSGYLPTDPDYKKTLERARKNLGLKLDSESNIVEIQSEVSSAASTSSELLNKTNFTDLKTSNENTPASPTGASEITSKNNINYQAEFEKRLDAKKLEITQAKRYYRIAKTEYDHIENEHKRIPEATKKRATTIVREVLTTPLVDLEKPTMQSNIEVIFDYKSTGEYRAEYESDDGGSRYNTYTEYKTISTGFSSPTDFKKATFSKKPIQVIITRSVDSTNQLKIDYNSQAPILRQVLNEQAEEFQIPRKLIQCNLSEFNKVKKIDIDCTVGLEAKMQDKIFCIATQPFESDTESRIILHNILKIFVNDQEIRDLHQEWTSLLDIQSGFTSSYYLNRDRYNSLQEQLKFMEKLDSEEQKAYVENGKRGVESLSIERQNIEEEKKVIEEEKTLHNKLNQLISDRVLTTDDSERINITTEFTNGYKGILEVKYRITDIKAKQSIVVLNLNDALDTLDKYARKLKQSRELYANQQDVLKLVSDIQNNIHNIYTELGITKIEFLSPQENSVAFTSKDSTEGILIKTRYKQRAHVFSIEEVNTIVNYFEAVRKAEKDLNSKPIKKSSANSELSTAERFQQRRQLVNQMESVKPLYEKYSELQIWL